MKHYLAAFISAAVFVSCTQEEFTGNQALTPGEAGHQVNMHKEIYVYLEDNLVEVVEAAQMSGIPATKAVAGTDLSELEVTKMYRLFPHAGEYEERTRRDGLHKWYVIEYGKDMPKTKAASAAIALEGVEHAEPAYQVKCNDTYYNDSRFKELWGIDNTSKPSVDINVLPVWKEFTTGNEKVIVSVVDEGVDLTHEDLRPNIASSGHFNYCNDNASIVAGDHGTHVAGVIAAVGNNGIGVAGVAGGNQAKGQKGVKIISSQGLNADGKGGNSLRALKEGADNGAVISQNSWGMNLDADNDGKISEAEKAVARDESQWQAYRSAIDYFIKNAGCDNKGNQLPNSPMKGGIVIFAAGNDNIDVDIPSMYEKVIAVGSITKTGEKSSFSNYGDWVDICAPGSEIMSTIVNNQYGAMDGTSMACPYVSGVAALIVSYFGGQGFTNEMLWEKILGSTNKDVISPSYRIGGLVDAYGAFMYGNDLAPDPVADLQVSGRGNNIDCTFTVPSTPDDKSAYGVLVMYSEDRSRLQSATPENPEAVGSTAFVLDKTAGESITCSVSRLEFEKEYYVKAYAYSYGRNYSAASEILTATTTENNVPVITLDYDGDYSVSSYETLTIPVSVNDPDDHEFEVSYNNGSEADALAYFPDGWRLTIQGNAAAEGTYSATIIAKDEFGGIAELEVEYTIKSNTAPVKIKDVPSILMTRKGQEQIIDMSEYASDEDGEQLAYELSYTSDKIVHINVKGDILTATATAYGTTDVTLVAKDARGEAVTFEFTVVVKDPSKPVSVYPNPVKDYVNVGTLDVADTRIIISGSAGKVVYDDTVKAGALEPARIDMRDFAPGVYKMTVKFSGKEYSETVVKL